MWSQIIFFIFSVIIFSVNCVRIIYKEKWQIHSEEIIKSPSKPSSYVVIFQTNVLQCSHENACAVTAQYIKDYSLKTWGQMVFNYLIGGDGHIYEGSGFYEKAFYLRSLKDKCILIAFICDFTEEQKILAWEKLNDLLNFLRNARYLYKDYILLSSQQLRYDHQCKDGNENLIFEEIKSHPQWKNITLTIESKLMPFF